MNNSSGRRVVCSVLLSYILLKVAAQTRVATHIGFGEKLVRLLRDENYCHDVSEGRDFTKTQDNFLLLICSLLYISFRKSVVEIKMRKNSCSLRHPPHKFRIPFHIYYGGCVLNNYKSGGCISQYKCEWNVWVNRVAGYRQS